MRIFRVIVVLTVLIFSATVPSAAQSVSAADSKPAAQPSISIKWMSFEEALAENALRAQSGLEPKKIYIDVYTDWCGWCKRLDATTFANAEIAAYMNSVFLPVKLNAERTDTVRINEQIFVNPGVGSGHRSTHQLAATLLNGQMSYPTCTFLDEQGKSITIVPGYMEAPTFETLLHFIGENAYKTMNWESFQQWYAPRARVR